MWDNQPRVDGERRTQWWVILIAAVLAALMLLYSTESWAGFGFCIAAIAIFWIWQRSRATKPAATSICCAKCGEKLNPNARQCASCGSASWTYIN